MSSSQIKYLPKEALFNLLLQLEPREMKIVCGSLNRKVREICQSDLFKKAYSYKYYLLKGKIEIDEDKFNGLKRLILKDEIGNKLDILYKNDGKTISAITYEPFKQLYASTYKKNLTEDEIRLFNPIKIDYDEYDDGEYNLHIGREDLKGIFTVKGSEIFLNNYNKEVKEFLQYIDRESWWNPDIQFHDNEVSESIREEFLKEVTDLLNKN